METQLNNMWAVLIAVMTICAGGFFSLVTLFWKTSQSTNRILEQIKNGLFGTFEQPGIVPKVYKNEESIKDIKDKCDKRHLTLTQTRHNE